MNAVAIILVAILVTITIGLSIFSQRFTRTTTDFYLAGRKVGAFTNASAISGIKSGPVAATPVSSQDPAYLQR